MSLLSDKPFHCKEALACFIFYRFYIYIYISRDRLCHSKEVPACFMADADERRVILSLITLWPVLYFIDFIFTFTFQGIDCVSAGRSQLVLWPMLMRARQVILFQWAGDNYQHMVEMPFHFHLF